MKSGKKIYILYHGGTYGSWIRWLIEYANDIGHRYKIIPSNPIIADGSSHSMITLPNAHPGGLEETMIALDEVVEEACGYKIYRVIPIIDSVTNIDMFLTELLKRKNTEDKVIYVDVDGHYNKEIAFLNIELKIDWIPHFNQGLADKVRLWDCTKSEFEELERWQQRELISLYYEEMIQSLTESPKLNHNMMMIKMSDIFKEDIISFTTKILKYCDLPIRKNVNNVLRTAHDTMMQKQASFELHRIIYNTVDACVRNENIDIPPLSLFAEAMVQNLLFKQGKEIRCYQLNKFPCTTGQLMELII